MKTKRKIIAIWTILLLIATSLSVAEADETSEEANNETILVELATVKSDGITSTETMLLTEEELVELENTISLLIEKIQSTQNWENLKEIIEKTFENNPFFNIILGIFSKLKLSRSRALVISSGRDYKFNPLKKSELKIRKKATFWHYSSEKLFKGRTIILRPLAFQMKILRGAQFGFMTGFTGIYLFVSRSLPEKSYTFFMGTARRIAGMQVLPNL